MSIEKNKVALKIIHGVTIILVAFKRHHYYKNLCKLRW
jgi:hypothetical protein